jgi:hypothetical protein
MFDLHAIELAGIDPRGKVGEVRERLVATRRDQPLHRYETDLLDRGQRIADAQLAVLAPFNREIRERPVDVRRQDTGPGTFCLLLQRGQSVGIA